MNTEAHQVRSASTPRERWRDHIGELGRTSAAVAAHAPENAAYGLIAVAPLGPAFGPGAMMLTLVGVVVANAIASVVGGGRLVSGARAALALLTAGFVAELMRRLGPTADPWTVPLLLMLSLVGAGVLQTTFGLLRFGGIVKFTPYPVRLGLGSGIGLLLLLAALPVALGQGFGSGWESVLQPLAPGAVAVGLTALLVAWAVRRRAPRLPAALLGLVAGTALHALLMASSSVSLSPTMGTPVLPAGALEQLRAAAMGIDAQRLRSALPLIASYALTVAVLCSLDTLLTTSIVDGRLRTTRNADRELVAQGLASIASALVGGQATSPSVPRTMTLIEGRHNVRRHTILAYAAMFALLIGVVPELIGLLPLSAVGGVLMAQALPMLASTHWRTPWELWNRRSKDGKSSAWDHSQRRLLASNWAICSAVALGAVLLGLGPAVLLGAGFAVILFVRANMRDVVRRSVSGQQRRSLKMRHQAVAEQLLREGDRIAVVELEGALFFGTADDLRMRLQALPPRVETAVLDLHQVHEIDMTGARILFEIAEDWRRSGRRLVLAEWSASDQRRRAVEAVAGQEAASFLHFVDTTDLAMEQVEDALIAQLPIAQDDKKTLELAQTTIAHDLNAAELALLRAIMKPVRFEAGHVIFRQGDPGDALYVSLAGEIGLQMPGSQRRLASFAPGVSVGEMAVLAHGMRSAEAIAESDVIALRLSVESFDLMKLEQPALAAKILNNIALHLAGRVRMLTGDLSHWVSRSTTARATGLVALETITAASSREATD